MTLSDGTIKDYLDSGKISIDPIENNQIQQKSSLELIGCFLIASLLKIIQIQ